MNSFSISVKDYTIAAGETLRVHVPGTFFQLMESTAAVDVSLMRSHSIIGKADAIPLGFSIGPLNDAEAFDGVEIYSATTQEVKVCIARGAVDLRSITQITGTVKVVNGELQRVLAGSAFIGVAYQGAVVGEYAHTQLWNPAGSGKNVIVTKSSVFSPSFVGAFEASFNRNSSALLNDAPGGEESKLLGGASGVAMLKSESNAGWLGFQIGSIAVPAAAAESFSFSEPIVIPPGVGMICQARAVNTNILCNFQWIEEDI